MLCRGPALFLALLAAAGALKERSTGFDFPQKSGLGSLRSLGVRKKGPIKVYAVGLYENNFSGKAFVLRMAMGVSAAKMTGALVDAVRPRLSGDAKALDDFAALLTKGLPQGCKRDMCLTFGTSGGKLSVNVDGKNVGSVSSKPLALAFEGVYCDKNAVCCLNPVDENCKE
ncbi:hypothetical protein M885DRAFT_514578 [Pelagophyceae sp. CCMP2097]|nr:hypothetical protein M885DRAFT_514578 [Pelagophyceae sp. CCMP2097]|mmetsp:Transcript_19637/g.66383  ORF Transcript_19637/g.66383 Transcript_19637/m.66383 type:complete len:171 (-) Transcript_19637:88-600(-)|eukprot:CAMPEP_0184103124 /NCGR_PEP_ID=MMETSP0974-20121125/13690_1 /TAXON_ID=483370 /ORGANISM="non described non described, Strain CCMP2097" /LENGTH=170 /DNA_ID=CAMNT_0026406081 /DNA_START=38 /DNA_END=550 /DNA_ORIENTATION=+